MNPPSDDGESDYWRSILVGDDAALVKTQRLFSRLQSPPRCKLCKAPFAGPWAPVLRTLGFRPGKLNQQMCGKCTRRMEEHDGGAEIPVSVLYVDVRGSTTLGESVSPAEFKDILSQFYITTAAAIESEQGIVDHMAGDGVMALWIPGFVGDDHPQHAAAAGRRIVTELVKQGLPVGVGVHTGIAYVGVVGGEGSRDFTVLGDTANTVARLSSEATSGQLIMSEAIVRAAHLDTSGFEHRPLQLKGKSQPFPTWIETLGSPAKDLT